MAIISQFVVALLAGTAAAFPGMAGTREKAAFLPRNGKIARTASAAASSMSSYPPWQPAQPGEGKHIEGSISWYRSSTFCSQITLSWTQCSGQPRHLPS